MIEALTFLLLAQLAGEVIANALRLPISGPVIGLVILAAVLGWRGITPALHDTSLALLRNLSLLFVPAGVGIIRQAGILADNWLSISVALVVSSAATLAVTALVFRWAQARFGTGEDADADGA